MARKKNPLLRTLVPLALLLAGVGVVVAVGVNSTNQQSSAKQAQTPPADPAPAEAPGETPVESGPAAPASAETDPALTAAAGETEPDEPAARTTQPAIEPLPEQAAQTPAQTPNQTPADTGSTASLRARVFTDVAAPAPIGSLDGEGGHLLYAEFSQKGAGIASLKLGDGFFKAVGSEDHVELQALRSVPLEGSGDLTAIPFAALWAYVDGSPAINLAAPGVWHPIEGDPGAFEAVIEDAEGSPVLRVVRRFGLVPGTFRLTLTRRVENLTDSPLTVHFDDTGPIDLATPKSRYGGDKRRLRFGYLHNERLQAGDSTVTADGQLAGRTTALGKRTEMPNGFKRYEPVRSVWPTPETIEKGRRLVWTAFTSRYFAVALHPIFDPDTVQPGGAEKVFTDVERVDRLVLNPYETEQRGRDAVMVMRVTTAPETVPANGAVETSIGVYAGPLLEEDFRVDPLLDSLNLEGLVVYNFGGPCGEMCTFGWMTHVLLAVLRFNHGLTGDWALSIIILVLMVRTVLHPITRWSQIRLQRFSKQMQSMAPKQQKLREKYGDDPKKMQTEMARLWKEEGINPAGALGCLPMLLQSPVWIALYATLYFATEMRHEPAFYGVFQSISGGEWKFLADLSSPDAALPLPSFMHFTPPLLGNLYGRIESINLLPLLMAVLFYAHQKFLSPPPSASMTPEQEQQQKIIRIMFPIMMPIFMYPAPSGLVFYFITNSALAIIENKHIRSSAEKKGLLDIDKIKEEKAAKRRAKGGGGFLARMQALAEERQQMAQGGGGKKKVANVSRPKPEVKPKNYKKRK